MRVVGFLEYGEALARFDKLAATATPQELKVFDDLVRERDELAIYVNLSRRLPHPPSNLDEKPLAPSDSFERRGLNWMTGLARVELGAILASFTYVKRAFSAVAGKGYDRAEYHELLLDGLRMHFWALANDPALPETARKFIPDQRSLNYIRRMTLVQAFFDAALNIAANLYSDAQLAELKNWKNKLDEIQAVLLLNAEQFFARQAAAGERSLLASQCQNACKQLAAASGR